MPIHQYYMILMFMFCLCGAEQVVYEPEKGHLRSLFVLNAKAYIIETLRKSPSPKGP